MRQHALPLALIVALSAGLFANALRADFVWDDTPIVCNNKGIRDLRRAPQFFAPSYWRAIYADYTEMPERRYRPVPEVSFALDYALWGLRPFGYHLTNVLIHVATCILVYLLAHRLFRHGLAATFCALLFAAHPIHVEPVTWVKSRHDLLSCAFMLLSAVIYLRCVESPASPGMASASARRIWWYPLGVLSLGAAMLSKPTALVLPALLALYVWCFVPRERAPRALLAIVPLVGIVTAFFAVDQWALKVPGMPLPPVSQMASGVAILGKYLRLFLLPVDLCLHYDFAELHSLVHPKVLSAAPLAIALVAAVVVAFRRSKMAFFAVAWIAVALAPLCYVLPRGRPVADARAYMPSVGICILIALASVMRTSRPMTRRRSVHKAGAALCIAVLVIYGSLTVARSLDWVDQFTLWSDTLAKNPRSWAAHRYLGLILARAGQPEKALQHLRETIELRPTDTAALHQAASLAERTGRTDDAIEFHRKLVALLPSNVDERVALGMLYAAGGERTKAIRQLSAALELDPNKSDARYNLGIVRANSGEYAEAISHFEEAARLAPSRSLVHLALALAYERVEQFELALAAYQECVALPPEAAAAWLGAGRCHEELGQIDEAVRCYRRCVELGGPDAQEAGDRLVDLAPGASP